MVERAWRANTTDSPAQESSAPESARGPMPSRRMRRTIVHSEREVFVQRTTQMPLEQTPSVRQTDFTALVRQLRKPARMPRAALRRRTSIHGGPKGPQPYQPQGSAPGKPAPMRPRPHRPLLTLRPLFPLRPRRPGGHIVYESLQSGKLRAHLRREPERTIQWQSGIARHWGIS